MADTPGMSRRGFIAAGGLAAGSAAALAGDAPPAATARVTATVNGQAGSDPDGADYPATVPSVVGWVAAGGYWKPGASTRIAVPGPSSRTVRAVAGQLATDLQVLLGRRIEVVAGAPNAGDIALSLDANDTGLGDEGYLLDVGAAIVAVRANAQSGLLYGTQSVLQALAADPDARAVPCGTARDIPAFRVRGEMIDCGRKYYPLDYLRAEIRRLAWYKLNTLHLHLTDWNGFRFESKAYPDLASPEHYTQAELRALDEYAVSWGVTLVPELDVPCHSSWLTRYDARLRLTDTSMDAPDAWPGSSTGGWTLDVTSTYAREFVKTLLREMAQVFSGPYLHIGGDEIPYDAAKAASPALVSYAAAHGWKYPGDVLVDFINDLNTTVRSTGKTAELWQWWDYNGQHTSLSPDTTIRVDEWLDDPTRRAHLGYPTVGTDENSLYVSPGYGVAPGQYGYMPAETVYQTQAFPRGANIEGYKISRWSDKAENQPPEWFDFFAHRPRQVLAERVWGGPRSADAEHFYARADRIGDAPPNTLTAIPWTNYTVVAASSQETVAEHGPAACAIDGNPQTAWVSRYSPLAEFGDHTLQIDLGAQYPVAGIRVMPRQDGKTISALYATPCRTRDYRIEASADGKTWHEAATGTLANEQPASTIVFRTATRARQIRFIALSDWAAVHVVSVAELAGLRA